MIIHRDLDAAYFVLDASWTAKHVNAIAYMLCSSCKDVKGLSFRWVSKPVAGSTIVQQCRNTGGYYAAHIYIYICMCTHTYMYNENHVNNVYVPKCFIHTLCIHLARGVLQLDIKTFRAFNCWGFEV